MRKISALLLLACLTLTACVPTAILSTGGGPTAASLGPDRVQADADVSTLPERIQAGVSWLWASYAALKERVDPAVEPMKSLYVAAQEAVVAVQAGDLLKALALYGTARALVTEITGGA